MTRATACIMASILAEGVADVTAKEYQASGSLAWWLACAVAYTAVWVLWLMAMRAGVQLGRGAIVFWVSGALLAILVGVGMYHETITPRQWLGVLAGAVSVALVAT